MQCTIFLSFWVFKLEDLPPKGYDLSRLLTKRGQFRVEPVITPLYLVWKISSVKHCRTVVPKIIWMAIVHMIYYHILIIRPFIYGYSLQCTSFTYIGLFLLFHVDVYQMFYPSVLMHASFSLYQKSYYFLYIYYCWSK